MLQQIPCHLIAGPLGAGKTSLLRSLLAEKPADERWALLINEFGLIGLDAALLDAEGRDVSIREVAGGCLCCVNGAPFQVGLNRLLRQAKPQRLFIEASGLGHPLSLIRQLQQAPWNTVLQLQPLLMVLDAPALLAGQVLTDEQHSAAEQAGLLLLNKSADLTPAQRQHLQTLLPNRPLAWTEQARLPLAQLPTASEPLGSSDELPAPNASPTLTTLWRDPQQPICHIQQQAEGWAIGWRWHPSLRFSPEALSQWLEPLPWQRAKLIVQHEQGALALNALAAQPLQWHSSPWRRDSRLELIFTQTQDAQALELGLRDCLLAI